MLWSCSLQEGNTLDHSDKHLARRMDTSPRRSAPEGPDIRALVPAVSILGTDSTPDFPDHLRTLQVIPSVTISLFPCWHLLLPWASLVAQMLKICLQCGRGGFSSWVRKIPWRREWLPTPVFLPGEFHRQTTVHGVTKNWTWLSD